MQEEIFDMLLKEEEVSWRTILYDLVKSEKMDPWDIDITRLTQRYIEVVKEMQEYDLRVSGKILLAAAVLLKIKSSHLVDNDIVKFDAILSETENEEFWDDEDGFLSALAQGVQVVKEKQTFTLIPRNPQPRNRKVSINDLVNALQHALATKKKALEKIRPVKFTMPKRSADIMEVIRDVYHKVVYYSKKENKDITFTKLLPPRAGKEDKVYTFVPLLHLENQQKINMEQKQPFDEIYVKLTKSKLKSS